MNFDEKFLYHIWDGIHLKGQFETCDKQEIKIMYQGHWNTGRGPDFKDAVIKIGNDVKKGDIEIHLKTKDWIAHNHNEDYHFNNVILHCVYEHNSDIPITISEDGNSIPILELQKYLSHDIKKLLLRFKDKQFTPNDNFCRFFSNKDNDFIFRDLEDFGIKRFENKVKRFSAELFFTNFSDLLLGGIFEAFGYSKNKTQMDDLYKILREKNFFSNFKSLTYQESIAYVLGYAGLFDSIPKTFSQDQKLMWLELFNQINGTQDFDEIKWELFRLRPVTHPVVRLIQIIDFLNTIKTEKLFNSLLCLFSESATKISNKLIISRFLRLFQYEESILPEHFHPGKSRIMIVLFNIVYPIVMLYAQKMNFQNLENAILKLVTTFPGLPKNFLSDRMSRFMTDFQIKKANKLAITQQGILKLYFDYCQYHLCEECVREK
jgi:hypothetical protein